MSETETFLQRELALIEKGRKYDKLLLTCARQVDKISKLKESHERLEKIGKLIVEHTRQRIEVVRLKSERNKGKGCPVSYDERPCFIEFRENNIDESVLCDWCASYVKLTKPMMKASIKGRVFKLKAMHLINRVLKQAK